MLIVSWLLFVKFHCFAVIIWYHPTRCHETHLARVNDCGSWHGQWRTGVVNCVSMVVYWRWPRNANKFGWWTKGLPCADVYFYISFPTLFHPLLLTHFPPLLFTLDFSTPSFSAPLWEVQESRNITSTNVLLLIKNWCHGYDCTIETGKSDAGLSLHACSCRLVHFTLAIGALLLLSSLYHSLLTSSICYCI